jgi:hypothetical protein
VAIDGADAAFSFDAGSRLGPPPPDASSVLTCASPLASLCGVPNAGSAPEDLLYCPPTWSADPCAIITTGCDGFLAIRDGRGGVCAYDATTRALVMYAAVQDDIGPQCLAGEAGASMSVACLMQLVNASPPFTCSSSGNAAPPWYCATVAPDGG